MVQDELKYLLALSFVKDIGHMTVKRLLSAFRSPRKIFEASLAELTGIKDIKESRAKKIMEFDSWDRVEREIRAINLLGIRVIKYTDKGYPESLRQIDNAPALLYAKGTLIEEDRYAVAIVGSRNMTEYGKKIAETMAYELASCGITVVSGMARGIDTVSHKGALKAGGRSIAVLGCGLDQPYPAENRELFRELSNSGCVISEFPVGTPPLKEHFPKRNRLISGLSLGVLVVEATVDSGSLITANYALEQGRDVFAVPGSIDSITSEGTNALIKKGAKLVQKIEDILEELSPVLKGLLQLQKKNPEKSTDMPSARLAGLAINDEEKAICNILGSVPKHIDAISRDLKISSARLSGLLLNLEIRGIVRQEAGKNFYLSY